MQSDGRDNAWKKRRSEYLSFFYPPGCASGRFGGRVFFGRTLSLSVHPSISPYRETTGRTDKRTASARGLSGPQALRVKRIEG